MKRLRNSSGLPDLLLRQVVDWISQDLGIMGFDVECRKCSGTLAGTAYHRGSSYHSTSRPFVVLRVGSKKFPTTIKPYQYAQHKGRRVLITNRTEALVYIAAHELRHLWQAARCTDFRRSKPLPFFHGAKGKFSEVDTEAYALHMLRAWRKGI